MPMLVLLAFVIAAFVVVSFQTLRSSVMLTETSASSKTLAALNDMPRVFDSTTKSSSSLSSHFTKPLQHQEDVDQRPMLRFDWTKPLVTLDGRVEDASSVPFSPLAYEMYRHQSDCSKPLANFRYRNRFGLGSDLHVWTQALCNSMDDGFRVVTEFPWIFFHNETCHRQSNHDKTSNKAELSPMVCYFPNSELRCPDDASQVESGNITKKLYKGAGQISRLCQQARSYSTLDGTPRNVTFEDVRAAGIEYLFGTGVSPAIVEEAERQVQLVFASYHKEGIPRDGRLVPPNLITVHVRWGDKKAEMRLVQMKEYIEAVKEIVNKRDQKSNGRDDESIHIFLATEDPEAVTAFHEQAQPNWKIYVDQYFQDLLEHRNPEYNGNPKMTKELEGSPGVIALGSLLLAMEANDFVLTTASNWSRLMDELRKNILNPRCNNCTTMIDLRYGTWRR